MKIQKQKEDDLIFLENQFKLTIEGFENALKLINEKGKVRNDD